MVKIVNIFKAAGLWVGTIFLLYGNRSVASSTARGYEGHSAYAPSRSVEVGGKYVASRSLTGPPTYMSPLEIKIGGQLGHGGREELGAGKLGRFKTPVTERGGGYG